MAAPHVAGAAALLMSYFPQCSNKQVRSVLLKTAQDQGASGCDSLFGHGIVQVKNAYDNIVSDGCNAAGAGTALGGCEQLSDECTSTSCASCQVCNPFSGSCDFSATSPIHIIEIIITPDLYPSEISWTLQGPVIFASGDSVGASVRVCEGETYTFTMNDSYGDGICCTWGQ